MVAASAVARAAREMRRADEFISGPLSEWVLPIRQRKGDALAIQPVRLEDGHNHFHDQASIRSAAQRRTVLANGGEKIVRGQKVQRHLILKIGNRLRLADPGGR